MMKDIKLKKVKMARSKILNPKRKINQIKTKKEKFMKENLPNP